MDLVELTGPSSKQILMAWASRCRRMGVESVGVEVADDAGVRLASRRALRMTANPLRARSGLGHVIGIGGHAVANDSRGCRAARWRFEFFENQDAGAFAMTNRHVFSRDGWRGWGRRCGGRARHGGESADPMGVDGGSAPPAIITWPVAALDDAEGIADGVGAAGAGGGGGFVRALGANGMETCPRQD